MDSRPLLSTATERQAEESMDFGANPQRGRSNNPQRQFQCHQLLESQKSSRSSTWTFTLYHSILVARNSFVAEVRLSKVSQHGCAQPRYLSYDSGSDKTTVHSTLAARSSDSSCTTTTFKAAREVYDMLHLDRLSCSPPGLLVSTRIRWSTAT